MAPGRNRRVPTGDLPYLRTQNCGGRLEFRRRTTPANATARRCTPVGVGENSYSLQCRAVQSYRHVALPESNGGKTRAEISPAEQYPASATIVAN